MAFVVIGFASLPLTQRAHAQSNTVAGAIAQVNAAGSNTDVQSVYRFRFVPRAGPQSKFGVDSFKGNDLGFTAVLTGKLTIFGGYAHTDGKVDNFAFNPGFDGDLAHNSLKYTLKLGVTEAFPVAGGWTLSPRLEWDRLGSPRRGVNNTPNTRRKPLTEFKARISLATGAGWNVSAGVEKMTNEKYFKEVVPLLDFFPGNIRGSTRTYGFDVTKRF